MLFVKEAQNTFSDVRTHSVTSELNLCAVWRHHVAKANTTGQCGNLCHSKII